MNDQKDAPAVDTAVSYHMSLVLVARQATAGTIQCAYCVVCGRGAVELFDEGYVLVPLLLFGTVEKYLSQKEHLVFRKRFTRAGAGTPQAERLS